jgi:hypothetical protein
MILHSKIMVWNCRGAASTAFYRYCKQYVNNHCPGMLVILETRCNPDKLRKTFQLLGFDGFLAAQVIGYAGGIVVGWRKEDMTVENIQLKFQHMLLKVKFNNGKNWLFSPVYASPNEENRKLLWDDLRLIARHMAEAWMLAGDFNEIAYPSEKKGGLNASSKKCCKFINRINSCNLLDLGFVGSKFTWRGPIFHGGMRIFERLDRALCNDIWRLEFPEAFVKTLPRLDFSDHHPILICPFGNDPVHVARKFRFESAWQLNDTYNNMLSTCWSDNEHVVTNLQNLQTRIKEWKFNTIDDIVRKKKRLAARIGGDQARIYARNYNYGLKRLEQKLQNVLDEVLKHEEVMWFQRSRTKWLVDGDRNTRYYHLKTTNRRRRNNIVMLRNTEGVWVDDPRTLQVMVNKFYQDLFEKPDADWRWYQTNIS